MDREGTRSAADESRSRRLLSAAPSILFYVLASIAAVLLWPTSLGGCTTITLVSGHSMEPVYESGDIVVARCGAPEVGDIVVYQPESLGGARIIHRIVGGDGEAGWEMKGDNNDFVDPFTPTDDEVLGRAAIHLPKVGLAATSLTSPWIWLSLIVLALAILVWPGRSHEDDDETGDDETGDDDVTGAAPEADVIAPGAES